MAEQGDSLLRCSPCGAAGYHRLGAGAIQVRQYLRGCPGKAAVRSFLHQERLPRSRSVDYVPDHQDCAARTGSAMKWVFWGASALIAYTYVGYVGWLWLRARLFPWPVRRSPQEPHISVVMVVRNEAQVLARKLEN